jgi:hypothetical protein
MHSQLLSLGPTCGIVISLWVICLAFIELFSLGLAVDRVIEVGVSFYKL